jgi:hypothetical protein
MARSMSVSGSRRWEARPDAQPASSSPPSRRHRVLVDEHIFRPKAQRHADPFDARVERDIARARERRAEQARRNVVGHGELIEASTARGISAPRDGRFR